jgi:hypothetical protein
MLLFVRKNNCEYASFVIALVFKTASSYVTQGWPGTHDSNALGVTLILY